MASASGYGQHPTIYGHLSNEELTALYRESSWFQMDEHSRQQLLQETVNRSAAAKGELGACEVRFADLKSSTLGQQSGNVIEVNRSIFAQDTYSHVYDGHLIEEPVFDSNMRALETVLHEDIHAWQNQCLDGVIPCQNPELLAEYRANDFSLSVVPGENGNLRLGSHYLNGVTDNTGYYMYYFQSTERDAHLYSQQQTVHIMNSLEQKYGTDKSLLTYQKNVLTNGYQATFQRGQQIFGSSQFEREINQVLMNQYYGTKVPVRKEMETAVQKEMAASYIEQQKAAQQSKGETMNTSYKSVTVEEYDAALRGSVNAFYTHAINDPSMSREEAIAQTAQMSENYLNTMDEVHAAHEEGLIASEQDTAAETSQAGTENEDGIDSGAGNDGGLGDDDGGIE